MKDLNLCNTQNPAADPWVDDGPSPQASLQPFLNLTLFLPKDDLALERNMLKMNNPSAWLIEREEAAKNLKNLSECWQNSKSRGRPN